MRYVKKNMMNRVERETIGQQLKWTSYEKKSTGRRLEKCGYGKVGREGEERG